MPKKNTAQIQSVGSWIESRLPLMEILSEEVIYYKTPPNLNYLWNFGSIAGITLVVMILTGLWLAFHYTPHISLAFESVERIVRDVNYGWLLRNIHMNGASMFFIAIYIHMMRGLYYGSYKSPRELLWIIGVIIFLLLMATAFVGYTLPWGQMSYWGATVITNLLSALPSACVMGGVLGTGFWMRVFLKRKSMNLFFIPPLIRQFAPNLVLFIFLGIFFCLLLPLGEPSTFMKNLLAPVFYITDEIGNFIVRILWGGYSVDNPTLNRFFVFHFLLPFVIVAVTALHLVALHKKGSNNPTGIDFSDSQKIPFHPYYTIKDLFGLSVFFIFWGFFVFFAPDFFAEADNYIPANPLVTPAHIVPEWYFLPFYAILRSTPDKTAGVFLMFSAVFILFVVPWLDFSPIKSARYRPLYRYCYYIFIICCFLLGWAGKNKPEGLPLIISRITTIYYFVFFLIIMPILSRMEIRSLSNKGRTK